MRAFSFEYIGILYQLGRENSVIIVIMKKLLVGCCLALSLGLLGAVEVMPLKVRAQASLNATDALKLPGTGTSVKTAFPNFAAVAMVVVRAMIVGAGVLFLGLILISGYKLVFKADKDKELAELKKNLTTGVVGILIVAGAYWITVLVGVATGNNSMLG
jgi:hypothetical protein